MKITVKKYSAILICIVITMFSIGYALYNMINLNNHIDNFENVIIEVEEKYKFERDKLNSLLTFYKLEQISNGELYPNVTILNEKRESISLKDIILNNQMIVFKIFEDGCNVCLEQELNEFSQVEPKLESRVVILGEYSNYTNLKIMLQRYDIKADAFMVSSSEKFILDTPKKPYIIILDSNFNVTNSHIGKTGLAEFSEVYFNRLKDVY